MSQAGLIDIEQSHPQIPTQFDTDSGSAVPLANVLEILGSTVANATNAQPVFSTGSGNTVTLEIQVGAAVTGAPGDSNDAGLVSFDDTQFTVDANGFVQLIGGSMAMDTLTGDDGVAVGPDGAGNTDIQGSTVANATNAKPLYVDGDAASNLLELEIQVGAAITGAPGDSNDAGIVSFDDTSFAVDANGYVTIVGGGGVCIETNTGDDSVAVGPDAGGDFNWIGLAVANATHAKPVYFKDSSTANALDLDIQVATERTGAPGDKNDAGLSSYNDTQFTVDADGYVALVGGTDLPSIQTITSDDPTAVGPDANGNIDLTGEAVANATNAKPVFVDAGTNALNIEVQVAAAVTGAPGDKNDAGISSYNDTQFTADADGYIALVGGTDLPAIQTLTSDDPTIVGPDASGNIDVTGETVANATNAKPLFVDAGTNALNVEIQIPTTIDPGSAPGDFNDAGIASYSSAEFTVSANAFVELVHPFGPTPGAYNIGFDYNSGTGVFSITSASGTALSTANPGYITIWSKESSDPGKLVTIPITADVSFIDDTGSSEIIDNLFGTPTGVAYGSDMPFWIKAVLNNDEDAIAFCLTRNGGGLTSPAAANIGAPDDAVADAQNDYWAFDNLDETLYDLNPAMPIGVIYMQKSTLDDWTVQGLYASSSGVNFPSHWVGQNTTENFVCPVQQFGASASTHLIANGGTAPTFSSSAMRYQVMSNQMSCWFYMTGNTATDGAGAVTAQIAVPYTARATGAGNIICGSGYVDSPAYTGSVIFETTSGTSIVMRDINGNYVQNQDFSDGNRTISGSILTRTGDNP